MRGCLFAALLGAAGCLVPGETPFAPVETVGPLVLATNPRAGVDNVPVKAEIEFTFSEPLDAASLPSTAIEVSSGAVVRSTREELSC